MNYFRLASSAHHRKFSNHRTWTLCSAHKTSTAARHISSNRSRVGHERFLCWEGTSSKNAATWRDTEATSLTILRVCRRAAGSPSYCQWVTIPLFTPGQKHQRPTSQWLSQRGCEWAGEILHQWLQPSKEPNGAPFGRLDGWSTSAWDSLQN